MSEHQDWAPVTVGGSGGRRAGSATGDRIHHVHNPEGARLRKLDDAEVVRVKKLSAESVTALVGWRRETGLTQKQLDQRCSFPANTVNALESRREGPTDRQLRTLQTTTRLSLSLE
jgi:DNA-binding transcriptional regulator YiaG